MTVNAENDKSSTVSSDFLEDSQNSLSSGEGENMDKGEANVSFGDQDDQFGDGQRIPRTSSKLAGGEGLFRRHTDEASH